MAVTVAHLGRHSWSGAVKKGNWRTYGQKTSIAINSDARCIPRSFDRYNDFVCTHHVQTATGGCLDSARIVAQLFNLHSQRLVCCCASRLTSVCMRTYCCDAIDIRLCVRIVTVAQIAAVARIIMPKITQAGMMPPRRLTSAGVPIISCEISRTDAKGEAARGATRCARIRSSTQ